MPNKIPPVSQNTLFQQQQSKQNLDKKNLGPVQSCPEPMTGIETEDKTMSDWEILSLEEFETIGELVSLDEGIKEEVKQQLPELWQAVILGNNTAGSDTPELSENQISQAIFEYYKKFGTEQGITEANKDHHIISRIFRQLTLIHEVETTNKILSIWKSVKALLTLSRHFNPHSNNSKVYDPNHFKVIDISKATLPSINSLKTETNHIAEQFNLDLPRGMEAVAYSPDNTIAFWISTQDKKYNIVEIMDEGLAHSFQCNNLNKSETAESEDQLSPDKSKTGSSENELISIGQKAIIKFSKQSALRRMGFNTNQINGTLNLSLDDIQKQNSLANPLITAISDLASQTTRNSLWIFFTLIESFDTYGISPGDKSYWINFYEQENGSVIAKLHFSCLSFQMIDRNAFQINQPITIDTEILLDPENLNARKFGDFTVTFGELKSIKITENI